MFVVQRFCKRKRYLISMREMPGGWNEASSMHGKSFSVSRRCLKNNLEKFQIRKKDVLSVTTDGAKYQLGQRQYEPRKCNYWSTIHLTEATLLARSRGRRPAAHSFRFFKGSPSYEGVTGRGSCCYGNNRQYNPGQKHGFNPKKWSVTLPKKGWKQLRRKQQNNANKNIKLSKTKWATVLSTTND